MGPIITHLDWGADWRAKTNHNMKDAAKISVWLLQGIFMVWLKGFIGVVGEGGYRRDDSFLMFSYWISWDEHKNSLSFKIIDSKYNNFPWKIAIQTTKEITAQF